MTKPKRKALPVTIEQKMELDLRIEGGNEEGLPEGWISERLAQLTTKIGSGSTPKGGSEAYKPQGVPLIRSMNIRFEGFKNDGLAYLDDAQAEKLSSVEVRSNDVLLNITGASIGRVTTAPEKMHGARVNQHVAIVRTSECLNPSYLNRFLASPSMQNLITESEAGATRQALTKEKIEGFQIPLPPLPEQLRIADKLDTLLSRVDAGRERLERVPKLIKRFRQSVLSAAVSGELTREWRGGGDAEWEATLLNSLAHSITDGDHQAPPQATSGIPFITISAINDATLRLEKSTRFVPPSYLAALKATRVAKLGDILFSVTGSICIPAIVNTDQPFVFQRHIAIIKPNFSKISGKCLYYFLASPEIRKQGEEMATGTAQPTVSLSSLKAFEIPLPSLPEQAEIVRRVEALFAFADRLEARYASALQSFNRLTPALLDKAFRGELVPQDPNDEPASVLLERIWAQRGASPKAKGGGKVAKAVGEGRTEPKRRGRPPGISTAIPETSSVEEAIRTLETQKLERAQGTRQVSLFGTED
ncbi:restriction endonuclease subunit S [Deinococcus sp. QL22]|uniref:restriction endonuclease subunit S n=1 Tax=Deinococcus sp. QL22 TaxID=2939437 RepID=UPI002017C0FF|nr:restriction endonuclease subunit S [Deinococcus sp. QL22]UQN08430.1 restriction endonuclease subunit S [Deinococcus sp. QL22]